MGRSVRKLAILILLASAANGSAAPSDQASQQALDILKRSIAFRTVAGQGQVPAYAEYLASVLKAGGFAPADIIITPLDETAMLTARYRGSDPKAKPLLLAGHMDVVEAQAADWERDPFTPVIENGFIYGRGSFDNKFGVSTMVAALVKLKQAGFAPRRDVVLLLTGDEETEGATTQLLASQFANAELLLNSDAGGGLLDEKSGKPAIFGLQAAEKTYADFDISFTGAGGHSSRPGPENVIYRLAKATDAIAAYIFPAQASDLTRAYFQITAARTPGPLGEAMKRFAANPGDAAAAATLRSDPEYVGQVGTTCVGTMVKGGHALNALPQRATLSVNCRIFPGVSIESVQAKLQDLAGQDAKITVLGSPASSDASPLRPDVLAAVRKAVAARAPGVPVVPHMSVGASDSLYFRAAGVPSYGVGPQFMKGSDDYSHGLNERVPVANIDGALKQWDILIRELAK